jgi:CBS domain-containing protein
MSSQGRNDRAGELRPSERFLAAYNRIDKALRELSGGAGSFPGLVNGVARHNALVRHHRDDLLELGELRNAIVHDSTEAGFVVAEPNQRALSLIEGIAAEVVRPPLLIPAFERNVSTVQQTDPIIAALTMMHSRGYAQFPVTDPAGRVVGLLSERAVARWCAACLSQGETPSKETQVSEVLAHNAHGTRNFALMAATATVYDAEEAFRRARRLEAVLVSANGQPGERLLGIVTPRDIV